jgi:hypothetical protein
VARPAEVLGADVAVVGLCTFSIHGVCRVALWASHAFAQGQGQPLTLALFIVLTLTNNAIFVGTNQAVSHPLLLVNELHVAFTHAAD